MEAEKIDLKEWEYFGEGGSSTSYVKKLNGDIVVKLNNKDIPAEVTEKEYLASKAFVEAGLPSPMVYDFVTDGERFGFTSQRIQGKLSFARILSQEPDNIDRIAFKFAALAKTIHTTPADTARMSDARENLKKAVGDLSYLPEDVAETVKKFFSSIGDDKVCLHGDMNPGNLISFEGKDYWIGINEFAYGDPLLDIATMHIICNFLPYKSVKNLYHADVSTFQLFFQSFKQAYFGDNWNSKELEARIKAVSIVKFCAMASRKPEYRDLLVAVVRGQKLKLIFKRIGK